MPSPQTLPSRLIGALFVERGLVSESQIRVALEIQQETGQQLGQILVERFGVSRKELASVVAEQWAKLGGSAGPEDTASWRRLGEIFVERGFVTQDELDEALVRQRETGERLGEALVAQGVISKFELAGALAEQMAVLGDPNAEQGATVAQPEATVHQLHARDDADIEQADNVVELAPVRNEAVAEAAAPETVTEPEVAAAVELPGASEPAVDVVEPVEAPVEPIEAPVEPVEEPVGAEVVEPVEPVEEPVDAEVVEPVEAPNELEAPVEAEPAEPVEAPETVEAALSVEAPEQIAPPVEEVGGPQPAEVMLTDLNEALSPEHVPAEEPTVEPEQRTACLAFAPTTEGYRLVALEAVPAPGETIEVPEVGERVVLRVGRSPIPADDRLCAFVEEPVTPVLLAVH